MMRAYRHQHAKPDASVVMVRRAPTDRKLKPGMINRGIVASGEDARHEYVLHATKGYRRKRK